MTFDVLTTKAFDDWFGNLRDRRAKARIQVRIDRMQLGHFGDVSPVGGGVSELRIFCGPGYRVYFTKRKYGVIVLLIGGDKGSQSGDIDRAKEIAVQLDI